MDGGDQIKIIILIHHHHKVHDMTTDELLEAFPVTEITPQGDEVHLQNMYTKDDLVIFALLFHHH